MAGSNSTFTNFQTFPGNLTTLRPGSLGPVSNITGPTGAAKKQCTYYYVHLDADNHPIPSTMFGTHSQANPMGCVTKIARLTGKEMIPGPGEIQCFPKTGFRYWYQVKSVPTGRGQSRTEIVPNSMIEVKGVPGKFKAGTPATSGTGASCRYVEYKIFKTT